MMNAMMKIADAETIESSKEGDLSDVWESLVNQVYRVIDPKDGANMHHAQVRRLNESHWLYVDEVDGYDLIDHGQVCGLMLCREEDYEEDDD